MNFIKLGRTISKPFISNRISCLTELSYDKQISNHCVRRIHTTKEWYTNISKSTSSYERQKTTRNYTVAITILTLGMTFAAVPLYGIFCQMTGYGGTTQHVTDEDKLRSLEKNTSRKITVIFRSAVASNLPWHFKPLQNEIQVVPGETALAFYSAMNPTERPVIGVSTYNVIPFEAGPYFNKIQCFCFEEQMLNPHETVEMPVFFYIDPEYCEDPKLKDINEIFLSYTFFDTKGDHNV